MVTTPTSSFANRQSCANPLAAVFWGIAILCFLPGVILPLFWITPGPEDPLLKEIFELVLEESFDSNGFSLIGGLWYLFRDGEWVIATVLLLFSLTFPLIKLIGIYFCVVRFYSPNTKLVRWLERLGPWSMADVFVVSLTILAFKQFPGGTKVHAGIGYYFFLASVIAAMLAVVPRAVSSWTGQCESSVEGRPMN
jgi:hypothetical protein